MISVGEIKLEATIAPHSLHLMQSKTAIKKKTFFFNINKDKLSAGAKAWSIMEMANRKEIQPDKKNIQKNREKVCIIFVIKEVKR